MRFMKTESVLQTKNRSEPAKNRFSVALGVNWCQVFNNPSIIVERCELVSSTILVL